MKFNIDTQTFRDLNIFTSSHDAEAISKFFRCTKTIGGRESMLEMMNNPVADISLLRDRTASIRYFSTDKITLSITNNQLDLIEHYLKYDKKYLKNNLIDAAADYITNLFRNGDQYYIITAGIKNLINLFSTINVYTLEIAKSDAPLYLQRQAVRINEIVDIIMPGGFTNLTNKKLKFYKINHLDTVFKQKHKEILKELLTLVYELDVFETLAFVAEDKKMCFASYLEDGPMRLQVEGLYHPGIKNPVVNDINLKEDLNMTFLTGSNMAGKSSILKAVGISIYLAHIGFPIFAAKMTTTAFNGLITTINLPDNLGEGLSHYYTEVKRVKQAAKALSDHNKMFVIFDELFRGTNVKDAFDASLLIISELTKIKNSAFFISTHIVELADELGSFNNVAFKYMDTYFENSKPIFTYKLLEGISKERLGMYIVQNEGIIEIIKRAAENQNNLQ
ncbi:MAG: hypothetical protein V4687_04270 [Bacteroidota bacterium]